MRAWKYKRLMPKVIVARFTLIEPKNVIDLVGRSLEYIQSMLTKTLYRTEILEIQDQLLNATSIQNAIQTNYIRTLREIANSSPKDIGFLLSAMMMKFEADNVKTILRAKWAEIGVDEAMRFVMPAGRMDERRCRSVLENSKNISDVLDRLSEFEYINALREAMRGCEELEPLPRLEIAIDRFVYGEIYKAAGKLKGRDRKIAKTVLGIEIDSMNIKIILRGKSLDIDEDQIRHYLLPVSDIFSEKELETAIKTTDIKSAIESLLAAASYDPVRDYQYMLTDLLKEYESSQSLSQLEMVLDKNLVTASLRMLKRYTPYFNIGLVFAFLNAKWFEVRNLRTIVWGAENDVPTDRVRELLILPN